MGLVGWWKKVLRGKKAYRGKSKKNKTATASGYNNSFPATAEAPQVVEQPAADVEEDPRYDPENRYDIIQFLGKGAHGDVHLAVDRLENKNVSVELVRRDDVDKYVHSEATNHRLCFNHPQIIQFKEIFVTDEHLILVMEHMSSMTLKEYLDQRKKLLEDEARWLFQQLILGVDFCHKRGIMCRDLKLENLVINANKAKPLLKIREFGASKIDDEQLNKSLVGTGPYIAPDILIQNSYDGKAADVWACGVMLYCIVTGNFPFTQPDQKVLDRVTLSKLIKADYKEPEMVSVAFKDLLKRIFVPDSGKRITTEGIMVHPWYQKDLPAKAVGLNNMLLQQPIATPQTQEEIDNAVKYAVKGHTHEGLFH